MNRLVLTCALGCTMALAACGSNDVIVQAQMEGAEGPVPLRSLPLRVIPFDRDAIFDSLRTAYPQPEPEVPPLLLTLQDSIARAQEEWRVAETRWGVVRDSLKKLNDQLQGMNRASGQYLVLFREFNALEPQEAQLKRQSEQAFQRSTNLQNRFIAQANEIRLQRDTWADAAYQDVERIMAQRERELRRGTVYDTTDASGLKRVRVPTAGEWWVHARYDLAFEELYWNIPIQVQRGEPARVQLTRETAEVRPKF